MNAGDDIHRNSAKASVTLFTRERGPVCYERSLFTEPMLTTVAIQLLASGLRWYWKSERSNDVANASRSVPLPEERPLTLLDSDTVSSLMDDFRERDVDGYGRFIVLIGVDSDKTNYKAFLFEFAVESFVQREEGPIRIVVVQLGDSPTELVFVPHNPNAVGKRLLEAWGIKPSTILRVLPYNKLYTAQLESVIKL